MLPWIVNGNNIFNSRISTLIAELLPDNIESNKSRLKGDGFNHYLVNKIYDNYIDDKIAFAKAKHRYKKQFNLLSKQFQIKHAEISNMASIEWGRFYGRPCLEILLLDTLNSKHIQFSTIFSKHHIINSPKSIVKNKDKLLDQLNINPVYQYALKHKNCLGEIHWVKTKSLSGKAKRNFLRDVVDNGESKSKYRGRLNNAVFFELTEDRDKKGSFSRWIFLKDGTNILWQIRGVFLMNLSNNIVEKQGYVCREVNENEF